MSVGGYDLNGWVWLMTDVGLFIERYKFVICMFVDTLFRNYQM